MSSFSVLDLPLYKCDKRDRNIALLFSLNFWLLDGKREIVNAFMVVIYVAVKLYEGKSVSICTCVLMFCELAVLLSAHAC
jgi:hypothetical protein